HPLTLACQQYRIQKRNHRVNTLRVARRYGCRRACGSAVPSRNHTPDFLPWTERRNYRTELQQRVDAALVQGIALAIKGSQIVAEYGRAGNVTTIVDLARIGREDLRRRSAGEIENGRRSGCHRVRDRLV